MPKLQISGRVYKVPSGDVLSLLRSLPDGVPAALDAPCGGGGTCGKCRVGIDASEAVVSPPDEAELRRLPKHAGGLPEGYTWRLSCRCVLTDGCVKVHIPDTGDIAGATIGAPVSAAEQGLLQWHTENGRSFATVDGQPVWEGERVTLYGVAVDLGTTTVAVSLWDDAGRLCADEVFSNPTRAYGGDVVTRIEYCVNHPDGVDICAAAMREAVDTAIGRMAERAAVDPAHIVCKVVAGNAVMELLFAGISPEPLGHAPFTLPTAFGEWRRLGGAVPLTYMAPLAAAYVGGDILCGAAWLLWSSTAKADSDFLFLDLGTNGEMGLYQNGRWLFAATAAGPAFEGAHIACGMPAVAGAVTQVRQAGGQFDLRTVGNAAPVGFCGSGLIDAVAALLEVGAMDEYGGLDDDRFDFAPDVYLTQGDIRMLQTAKSAVISGAEVLLDRAGLSQEALSAIYLAGSFGAVLRPASAAAIGLLWSGSALRTTPCGNSSAAGAAAFWCDRRFADVLRQVCENYDYVELSGDALFAERFIDNMCFETEE